MSHLTKPISTKILLDELMPSYDISACYEILISSPGTAVYQTLLRHSLLDSPIAKFLMALRGLPGMMLEILRGRSMQSFCIPSFAEIENSGFKRLAEEPGREMVLGLVGQFWKPKGGLVRLANAEEFLAFTKAGYTKAALNLLVVPISAMSCQLSTETRVQATDPECRRKFLRYWKLIGPFSGYLRRDMLRRIKRETES